jgi:Na+/H+-dicarboxylate symporter
MPTYGGGKLGFKVFWNNITPSLTALGTCSSIATIPANLKVLKNQFQHTSGNVVIPLVPLHKDGSTSSIVK